MDNLYTSSAFVFCILLLIFLGSCFCPSINIQRYKSNFMINLLAVDREKSKFNGGVREGRRGAQVVDVDLKGKGHACG
ncbi:hypothetical protein VNO77_43576 [Canavalia gladiata]|uniref:Transmembrane protein n=1 Tax=Canavalia gladiata TaxID=3824 RepID=A0AAN9JV27_CANGL